MGGRGIMCLKTLSFPSQLSQSGLSLPSPESYFDPQTNLTNLIALGRLMYEVLNLFQPGNYTDAVIDMVELEISLAQVSWMLNIVCRGCHIYMYIHFTRGEPHSWWIRPRVNIVFRLHVICTIVGMLLYHCYLYTCI